MRTMARELDEGRRRALDAERAEAFRESARRFAHELKNPLTPIRFAVERLRRSAPDDLRDTVEVLAEESARLETMARSFAQFGRLPDGPAAEIDVADLVTRRRAQHGAGADRSRTDGRPTGCRWSRDFTSRSPAR